MRKWQTVVTVTSALEIADRNASCYVQIVVKARRGNKLPLCLHVFDPNRTRRQRPGVVRRVNKSMWRRRTAGEASTATDAHWPAPRRRGGHMSQIARKNVAKSRAPKHRALQQQQQPGH